MRISWRFFLFLGCFALSGAAPLPAQDASGGMPDVDVGGMPDVEVDRGVPDEIAELKDYGVDLGDIRGVDDAQEALKAIEELEKKGIEIKRGMTRSELTGELKEAEKTASVAEEVGVSVGREEDEKEIIPVTREVPLSRRLDVNAASAEELARLPGVGNWEAQNIVRRREQRGPFASTKQLLEERLVTARTYNRIQGFIRARKPREKGRRRKTEAGR